MKIESQAYKKLPDDKVQCNTCSHNCILNNGKYGFCGVRKNINGKLYYMNYGLAVAEAVDPIEKKPFYGYLPKSKTLTIASCGCNFCCQWCQNSDISQVKLCHNKLQDIKKSFELSPERIVKDAFLNKCLSIAYSYTEPTIYLEYALDIMKLSHNKGLKNIWVSNGYMSRETVKLIEPYLDAINIDLKCMDDKKYQEFTSGKLDKVLKNINYFYNSRIHLEITTLVVPGINDNKKHLLKIAKWILKNCNEKTVWHLSRAYKAYKMNFNPPPIELLHDTMQMAKNLGLKNIYIHNV